MHAPETLITSNKLFQLWHVDPKGDSGPACHDPGNWKLHVKHWELMTPVWWRVFKRNRITLCAYCGEKGTKQDPVNCGYWDGKTSYHSKCLSKKTSEFHTHDPLTCWPCKQKSKS